MAKNKVILVGAINHGNIPTCGATFKNQLFVKRFEEVFDKVVTVDTHNWTRRPWVLLEFIIKLIFHRTAKLVISTSWESADKIIKFLYYVRLNNNVFYWVVGGSLHKMVAEGKVRIDHMHYLKSVIVQGLGMCDELRKYGLDNVVYIPNSKDVTYVPSKPKRVDNKTHFVFLSRISKFKGCEYIFESVRALNKKYYGRFDVTFYGRIEKEYDSFLSSIHEFQNVSYKGVLDLMSNNRAYDELAKYDVMLFPTYWPSEGFPGIVIDSYIASLPIIATDWNLNRDVIEDGRDGWIIPVHNVEALTKAMQTAIEHPDLLILMSRDCHVKALQFDYRSVLSESRLKKIGLL